MGEEKNERVENTACYLCTMDASYLRHLTHLGVKNQCSPLIDETLAAGLSLTCCIVTY